MVFFLALILFSESGTSSRKRPHIPSTPEAAYKNHSRKQPAPVAVTFSASWGCPLTGASTVSVINLSFYLFYYSLLFYAFYQVSPGNSWSVSIYTPCWREVVQEQNNMSSQEHNTMTTHSARMQNNAPPASAWTQATQSRGQCANHHASDFSRTQYTPISINVVGQKGKAYKTRPNGSLGIHFKLHIGGKRKLQVFISHVMYLVCPELDNLFFHVFSLANSAKI